MDQNLVYIFIFISIAVSLLLIVVVAIYLRLVNKYIDLKEGRNKEDDPRVMIEKAQQKSDQLLADAHIRSREIVSKADDFLAKQQTVLSQDLEKVNQIYVKEYQKELTNIKETSAKVLQNMPNDVKTFMIQAVDDFRLALSQEVTRAQSEASKVMQEAYKKALTDIDKYREERMKQIDESAGDLVAQVTKRVLGKEITSDEHEKLVVKALEEAKKQGIL
jgi:vacuolar-type H+-ATPase subunit H